MRPRIPRLVALAAILAACAADPTLAPRDCTPGQTATCACAGASGVQTCGSDGRLGACACPDVGGTDVVAVVDAPVVDVVSPEDRPAPMDTASVADALDGGEDAPVDDAMTPDDAPAADVVDAVVCDADLRNDPLHCGACGRRCARPANTRAVCASGTCATACEPNFSDCDMDPANGCETNTQFSTLHCGRCGNQCSYPNAIQGCRAPGTCFMAGCNRGWCDRDRNPANGCESPGPC